MSEYPRSARMVWVAVAMVAWWFIAGGCASPQRELSTFHRLDRPAHSDSPRLTADELGLLLDEIRTGDIILGVKEDPVTALARLITVEPSYFTHSGTLEVVDEGAKRVVRVWHAIGDFRLFHFSPHVLGKVRGGVRTIGIDEFIRMYDAIAVVRLPDARRNPAMVDVCRRYRDRGVAFDPFVDCTDHTAVCCTELTALAVLEAGYPVELKPAQRTTVASVAAIMNAWNITTQEIFMASQFERLPGARVVAVISRYGRMETYLAMRDAATLLHEQVAAGHLQPHDFSGFDARRLMHFQPRMELFLRGVEGLAREEPTLDAAEIRRRNLIVLGAVFHAESPDASGTHADVSRRP